MFYDNKHSPELQEWCYRMMNDPEQFERWRYIDTINDYRTIIAELEKLYVQTPVRQVCVLDRYTRARIQSEMKEAKRDLAKTQWNTTSLRNTRQELQ